jgi:hypothetical protein
VSAAGQEVSNRRIAAIGMIEGDAAFIDIVVEGAVFLVHVGWREAQAFAQAVDEGLIGATFRPAGRLGIGDELFEDCRVDG